MPKTSLPQLAQDPDARLVRWGWIAWGALTLYLLLRIQVFDTAGAARWIALVPLIAFWLLWPLVRGGGALWRWMRATPHMAWNGSYYEFDGRQMRVLFDASDVFVVADDVFAVLGVSGRAIEAERVRLVSGRDGLHNLPGRRELVFSERGLYAWLDRRTDDKAVGFRRWFERQVIAPYRRREDIGSGIATSATRPPRL